MPTDTEIWERACERVGLWKRGQVCKGCFFTPHESKEAVRNARWENGTAHHVDHEIPAPAIGDPAAVVAMVEWLIKNGPSTSYFSIDGGHDHWIVNGYGEHSLPLALAAAVLAVPQETQP